MVKGEGTIGEGDGLIACSAATLLDGREGTKGHLLSCDRGDGIDVIREEKRGE
jgi:hypothetical protein